MADSKTIVPITTVTTPKKAGSRMFNRIAPKYDF
jgi:hypothetical protein